MNALVSVKTFVTGVSPTCKVIRAVESRVPPEFSPLTRFRKAEILCCPAPSPWSCRR
ncbi:hypothetical protein ES332_D06G078600v1 [Gossypium tomentosum]|uniref:Uncharacterized protein n=1 Tax=Gossypium tomentosum TaxID=34277 RepID=A0A5D2KGQ4_GOSTO|nr:hypothetical protein ES332_D06G078600v1 [Gossypium tomentosum]